MDGTLGPYVIPRFVTMREIRDVHSIELVILKFVNHCRIIACTWEILIRLTTTYKIIILSVRMGHMSSLGKAHVPQSESGMQDIVALRWQFAVNRPTREFLPKTFTIKTYASFLKRNSTVTMKTEGATKIFPWNSIRNSMKSKWNTGRILLKSVEELDGGRSRTNLLNRDKIFPS
jgi:hypothetical protein